jgi:hypothetical protein
MVVPRNYALSLLHNGRFGSGMGVKRRARPQTRFYPSPVIRSGAGVRILSYEQARRTNCQKHAPICRLIHAALESAVSE